MGTSIVVKGASLAGIADYLQVPVMAGLVGLCLPGVDEQTTRKNWAKGKPDFQAPTGTPVYGDYNVSIKSDTDFFDLGIEEQPSMTFIIVGRTVAEGVATYLSNYLSPRRNGANGFSASGLVLIQTNQTIQAYAGYSPGNDSANGQVQISTIVDPALAFGTDLALMLRMSEPSGTLTARNFANGLTSTTVRPSGQRDYGSATLRAGKSLTATSPGPVLEHAIMVWNRALTDVEATAMHQWVKAYLARRGVVIA